MNWQKYQQQRRNRKGGVWNDAQSINKARQAKHIFKIRMSGGEKIGNNCELCNFMYKRGLDKNSRFLKDGNGSW